MQDASPKAQCRHPGGGSAFSQCCLEEPAKQSLLDSPGVNGPLESKGIGKKNT
jgi:hypothetical protein